MQKKVLVSVISGLILATVMAAAKSYVDVEKLKLENKNTKEIVIEIRTEQRIHGSDIKEILKRMP